MSEARTIIIEGWRGVPHSYAMVGGHYCLELLRRPDIRLLYRDVPFVRPWQTVSGLFPANDEASLRAIPQPAPREGGDVTLRLGFPLDFAPSASRRTAVWGTSETCCVPTYCIAGGQPLAGALAGSDAKIITCSNWAKRGFIASGAAKARVSVVPAGFDPNLFYPLPEQERRKLRAELNWNGFVFLNIGAMTENKGADLLLRAFADVCQTHPDTRLVMKGLDYLYDSRRLLSEQASHLSPAEIQRVASRLAYFGVTASCAEMARLYQAADAYVAPYFAEGFNLPVLEAAACGLPVICTAGGPTDDFTSSDFASYIRSQLVDTDNEGEPGQLLEPDLAHLIQLMDSVIEDHAISSRARQTGPDYVAGRFTWKHSTDRLLETLFSP